MFTELNDEEMHTINTDLLTAIATLRGVLDECRALTPENRARFQRQLEVRNTILLKLGIRS